MILYFLNVIQKNRKISKMAPRQTMLIKAEDGEMIECEVISTVEKESSFQKSAPIINPRLAGIFGFLNLIPGKN